MLVKTY